MIFLDNDVLDGFVRPNPDEAVISYLQNHRSEQWIVPSVVLYEFLSFYSSQSTRHTRRRQLNDRIDGIVPLDEDAAAQAASLEVSFDNAGVSLDTGDLLVAAIARSRGGTLATRNKNDFDKAPIHELMAVDIVPTA